MYVICTSVGCRWEWQLPANLSHLPAICLDLKVLHCKRGESFQLATKGKLFIRNNKKKIANIFHCMPSGILKDEYCSRVGYTELVENLSENLNYVKVSVVHYENVPCRTNPHQSVTKLWLKLWQPGLEGPPMQTKGLHVVPLSQSMTKQVSNEIPFSNHSWSDWWAWFTKGGVICNRNVSRNIRSSLMEYLQVWQNSDYKHNSI